MSSYYSVVTPAIKTIVRSWPECQALTRGISDAKYKKFPTELAALKFIKRFTSWQIPSAIPGVKLEDAKVGPFYNSEPTNDRRVVCFVDGSYISTTNTAGYGVHFPNKEFQDVSVTLGAATISRAEAAAIAHAVHIIGNNGHIVTDSKYCYDALRAFIEDWKDDGSFAKRDHADLFESISKITEKRNFVIEHTRGHVGVAGNEAADALARAATSDRDVIYL